MKALVLTTTLLIGFAAGQAHAVLSASDIVAWYRLQSDATDNSGNGHDGVNNGATFVADPDRGGAASFNGSSSSINVSSSGYSITSHPNLQFSTSFWIKPNARQDLGSNPNINDVNPIMGGSSAMAGTSTTRGVIEIVGDGSWSGMGGSGAFGGIGVNSGGGAGDTGKVPTIDFYDGQWHHVLMQWVDPDGVVNSGSGANAMIYIDGLLAGDVASQTYNGQNGGTGAPTFVLGGPVVFSNGGAANKYYNGLLSDVVFFNRQLNSDEVLEAMRLGAASTSGVPEPATFSLLALGAMAVTRRRRRTA